MSPCVAHLEPYEGANAKVEGIVAECRADRAASARVERCGGQSQAAVDRRGSSDRCAARSGRPVYLDGIHGERCRRGVRTGIRDSPERRIECAKPPDKSNGNAGRAMAIDDSARDGLDRRREVNLHFAEVRVAVEKAIVSDGGRANDRRVTHPHVLKGYLPRARAVDGTELARLDMKRYRGSARGGILHGRSARCATKGYRVQDRIVVLVAGLLGANKEVSLEDAFLEDHSATN